MNYTVEEITNGIAVFRYADGSYANVTLEKDMSLEDIDDIAYSYAPKTGEAPSTIAVGHTRVAQAKPYTPPEEVEDEDAKVVETPEYLQNRILAYGDLSAQIEYITENGLEAWQKHVAEIKAKYPKPE